MKDPTRYGKSVYLGKLASSSKTDFFKRDFDLQCPEQQVFSSVWELETMVSSEGFHGYFGDRGQVAHYVPAALRTIGAPLCAAIVEEALGLLPASFPLEHSQRWAAIRSSPLAEQLDLLNKRFFDEPDDVVALLYAFVAAHPEVFGPTPPESSLPVPPWQATPAECDATARSLMDQLKGGAKALLRMAGCSVPLDELDAQTQRMTIDLANDLNKAVTEFQQGKAGPPPPTPSERDAMLRSLEKLQGTMLRSLKNTQGGPEAFKSELRKHIKKSRPNTAEDKQGGEDDNSAKS